jgi:uncharacterized protein (DUF58 family)
VRPRRCATGLALIALLLFSSAFILDDMAVLLAASLLLCGLLGGYILFDQRFRAAVASVSVQRSPERSQVRKGATLQVVTTITVTVPRGMKVTIRENVSHQVTVQDGITVFNAGSASSPVTQKMVYRITAMVHGESLFPGVHLSARDLFFENEIDLSADRYSGPSLFIQPAGLFEPASRRITAETREIEKMSVLSGFGIRALREYYAGDDMRKIDWKQSAKHDKLYVREYMGIMNLPPLLIVDLPWRGASFSRHEFDRMVAAVAGFAEYSVRTYQNVSVLLISGPNILSFISEEKDLEHCMTLLRTWMHPVERTAHLYRMADRSDLRSDVRHIDNHLLEEPDPATARFLTILRKNYMAGLQDQRMPVFTGQVIRTIIPLAPDEIFLFSLGIGDTSHIRQIVRQARTMKIRIHVRLPEQNEPASEVLSSRALGADTQESFA